jgi:ABC-type cobalt transport system substrate-binding protein
VVAVAVTVAVVVAVTVVVVAAVVIPVAAEEEQEQTGQDGSTDRQYLSTIPSSNEPLDNSPVQRLQYMP